MPLLFHGVAHPTPPAKGRASEVDLSRGEIDSYNLGARGAHKLTTPVNVEHEGPPIGRVLASGRGKDGRLLVSGSISDPETANAMRRGELLGLSLGTEIRKLGDKVVGRQIDHLAVCDTPRRNGCYVNQIDGTLVNREIDCASRDGGSGTFII